MIKCLPLLSAIERELRNQDVSNMIGVFGISSDRIIEETLHETEMNFVSLGKGYLNDIVNRDVYMLIAAKLNKFIFDELSLRYDISKYDKHELLTNIDRLALSRNELEDFAGRSGIEMLGLTNEYNSKDEIFRCIFDHLKKVMRLQSNSKIVLNIEIEFSDFSNNILRRLERINSPDLLLIINSISPVEAIIPVLNNSAGINNDCSDKLFRRYFSYDNTIIW